ncbi:UvrD-helicase domain-containing protein [Cochleicola gelatinilyticus]|uniref:DNA 3'-5' helicase n=1 Tax=Cochleicola gelatinilyticus TaxID=1763537 RepID=A0A167J430_9FLAO|nr:UvrD-helicase domain-containing protein [Cochleicola gelatinilyticus]OAB80311.1 hypothetical protein ULVI_06130 [Cochleicola gelatinilyticus]
MNSPTPFTIYNASAGSGKTFTLVKKYLLLLLRSEKAGTYKNLLAITFTNKAVAEMKERIVSNLVAFSEESALDTPSDMMGFIAEELQLTLPEIHNRSKRTLQHLLHHYASFSVETIDRFNHQLIRTFARDLKLDGNFEVTLDTKQLLEEAVDKLISRAGEDLEITQVLLDFALDKTDEDRSWDIAKDIVSASKILLNENDLPKVLALKQRSLKDFVLLKKHLLDQIKIYSETISNEASELLQLIETRGISPSDFSGGYFSKYLTSLSEKNFNVNFDLAWQNNMRIKPMYPGRLLKSNPENAAIIDELSPLFEEKFLSTKQNILKIKFNLNVLKNLIPLSVINLVRQEMEGIKEEKNIIPISEFNTLIYNEIKDQPAPFIYERLGEKYQHFFIDEFQDTSKLQWENLIPLVDNALSQLDGDGNTGSLLLVGDAKQSIYRWRGGLPEQFISLYGGVSPFSTLPAVLNLDTNYRSTHEIIDFNNAFFRYVSNFFGNPIHESLYKIGNEQKSNAKKNGYVEIQFIENTAKEEKDTSYCAAVLEAIQVLKNDTFQYSDICILTRAKKDGITLSSFLMEQGIPVISQETLLLQYSEVILFLVDILTLTLFPEHEEVKIRILDFLHKKFQIEEPQHTFFKRFLSQSIEDSQSLLLKYNIDIDFHYLASVSLYQSFEYTIRQCALEKNADAYLFGFMDFVYDFQQQPQADKTGFLTYWEQKKDSASFPAGEGTNAVQVMTIHKAKGLEFPAVIFPYADINIYDAKREKIWFPFEHEETNFKEVQLNFNKDIETFGSKGTELYHDLRNTLALDNLNLLYVTLTRAVERLYIFSETPSAIRDDGPTKYSQFFSEFLKNRNLWNETQLLYSFGKKDLKIPVKTITEAEPILPIYVSTSPSEHNLSIITTDATLWETEAEEAISVGNLLHDTMAEIKYVQEVEPVLSGLSIRNVIPLDEFNALEKTVKRIVSHPELQDVFNTTDIIRNEWDIITSEGFVVRPDRLNIDSNTSVRIIDYKTGVPTYHHEEQLNGYAIALRDMGFKVKEKILIYANAQEITINKF